MYNLATAQCFWFAGCIWGCMQALSPTALCIPTDKVNNRGKFKNLPWQKIKKANVNNILDEAKAKIHQFHEVSILVFDLEQRMILFYNLQDCASGEYNRV